MKTLARTLLAAVLGLAAAPATAQNTIADVVVAASGGATAGQFDNNGNDYDILLNAVITAGLMLLVGCATPGPFTPQDTTRYTIENTEKFVLLDKPTQVSVTCTGLQERTLADGRLEVVANVKNREARRIEVQINAVFKDDQGTIEYEPKK